MLYVFYPTLSSASRCGHTIVVAVLPKYMNEDEQLSLCGTNRKFDLVDDFRKCENSIRKNIAQL